MDETLPSWPELRFDCDCGEWLCEGSAALLYALAVRLDAEAGVPTKPTVADSAPVYTTATPPPAIIVPPPGPLPPEGPRALIGRGEPPGGPRVAEGLRALYAVVAAWDGESF
jgi:hypothetical protein